MSYDVTFWLMTVHPDKYGEYYCPLHTPEHDHPTYNLGKMFRACMDWDFVQGAKYRLVEVIPKIEHGIHELRFNREKYKQYEPPNGWGTIDSALRCLTNWLEEISDPYGFTCNWDVKYIWFSW